MATSPRPGRTPIGEHIARRWRDRGFGSEAEFLEHVRMVNGGEGVSRGAIYAWSHDAGIAIGERKLRLIARALAETLTDAAIESELNELLALVGRPSVEAGELDVDPEVIRQLGPAGRRFIENQIKLVAQLRRDIWQERGDSDGTANPPNTTS